MQGTVPTEAIAPLTAEPVRAVYEMNMVVRPGSNLWRIARDTYGDGTRYTVIYGANRGQIGDPDLIYPGQIFTLPPKN
jgi:nucleoid-associated protein YgaU